MQRALPGLALRRLGAVLQIGEGLLVGRDQARAGAAFDRHVADRHAPFHRQGFNRFAGIFDDIAGAAGGADLADDRQRDVLGADAVMQAAIDLDQHVLGLGLDQGLGREHMLDFRRANAMRQSPEGAVGGGVAVAADDRRAGKRKALFRTDDMNDALTAVMFVEIFDAEFAGVDRQLVNLRLALRIGDRQRTVGGRHVVIDHSQGLVRRVDRASGEAQAFKGLGAGHFMNEMAVDIEQGGSVRLDVDDMVVPDLVVKGAGLASGLNHDFRPCRGGRGCLRPG